MAGHGTGQIQAVGAGLCAACASVFAKLAVTSGVVLEMCHSMLIHLTTADKRNTSELRSPQQNSWTDLCAPVKSAEHIIIF